MSRQERTKEELIGMCLKGRITAGDTAKRLGMSVRQVENLKRKRREGVSLLHGNCGRTSARGLSYETKKRILDEYNDVKKLGKVNFTHFHEILAKRGVDVSYTAMRNVLTSNGAKSPKTRRGKAKIHKTRERRKNFGELLQTDATPYDWFGTGESFALHAYIDDARGVITGMHISKHECMDGYMEALRQTLSAYGSPEGIYADGLSIFFSKKKKETLTIEEELTGTYERKTQFGRICATLGIQLIHARSSQAKGRVERLWETLQSRLPIEFALRGIKTPEQANIFLRDEYMKIFNAQFGVNPETKSSFVPLPKSVSLDRLLTYKLTRKLDKGGCFSWHNVRFKVEGRIADCKVTILISSRIGVMAEYNDVLHNVAPISGGKENIASSDSVEAIISRFVFRYCFRNEHTA